MASARRRRSTQHAPEVDFRKLQGPRVTLSYEEEIHRRTGCITVGAARARQAKGKHVTMFIIRKRWSRPEHTAWIEGQPSQGCGKEEGLGDTLGRHAGIIMANTVNIKQTIYAAQRVTAVVLLNYYHRLLADRGRGFHDPTRIPHDSFASAAQLEAACLALGVCKVPAGDEDGITVEELSEKAKGNLSNTDFPTYGCRAAGPPGQDRCHREWRVGCAKRGAAGGWWTSGERAMQALVASRFEEAEDLVTQLEGAGQALAGNAPGCSSAAVHHAPVRPPRNTNGNGNGLSNGKAWVGDAAL
eukprot:jgi/Tetstr1/428530/TSEL_001857.t1